MSDRSAVATVQAMYDCFRQRDDDGFRRLCQPDLIWQQNEGFPNGRVCHGPDEVIRHVFDGNLMEWLGFGYAIERMLDAGDHVVVLGHYHGTHRVTGKAMRTAAAHVYRLRDGLISEFRMYADTESLWRAMR